MTKQGEMLANMGSCSLECRWSHTCFVQRKINTVYFAKGAKDIVKMFFRHIFSQFFDNNLYSFVSELMSQ